MKRIGILYGQERSFPRALVERINRENRGAVAEPVVVGGIGLDDWRRSWEAFSRPDDVVVHWGSFYTKLAAADGFALPRRRHDLRGELAPIRQPGGTLEECVERMGAPVTSLGVDGRGGRRLSALVALLAAITREE